MNTPKGMNNQVNYNNYNIVKNHLTEEKYPEVYKILHPHVSQMITDMENHYGNIEMTDEMLNSMADGIVERSGLLNKEYMADSPVDNSIMPDAVPVVGMHRGHGHWDRGGYRDGYWGYHNRSTLRDIASILLLGQVFGGRRPRWRW